MRWLAFALVLLSVRLLPAAETDPIVVIVDRSSSISDLSLSELRSIFLNERRVWGDGRAVIAINLRKGSAERVAFDRAVLGMSEEQVAKHWVDEETRGRARRPKEASSALLIQRVVRKTAGAISYVRLKQLVDGTKVVTIDGKSPQAADYPLRLE